MGLPDVLHFITNDCGEQDKSISQSEPNTITYEIYKCLK